MGIIPVSHLKLDKKKNKRTSRLYGRFIGQTSCGFVHNHQYFLKSRVGTCVIGGKNVCCIVLTDVNSRACCPYDSIESLLQNWEIEYIT